MKTINAIYDGINFIPTELIPVKGKYEVIITFTKPINDDNSKKQRILKHFGTWNDEDVDTIKEIIEERVNFSMNRDEVQSHP